MIALKCYPPQYHIRSLAAASGLAVADLEILGYPYNYNNVNKQSNISIRIKP
jgi:hypothetical protein